MTPMYSYSHFLASLIMSLMLRHPIVHRINSIYFPLIVFTAIGIVYLIEHFSHRNVTLIVFIAVYSVQFLFFARWVYSYGENSWCSQTTFENESYIYRDILIGKAVKEAKDMTRIIIV